MLLDAESSHLVLIDYQERLMPAVADGPAVLAQAVRLAQAAALLGVPVTATEQNPSRLGGTVTPLASLLPLRLAKMQFSAVAEGDAPGSLLARLRPPAPPPSGPRGNARSLPKHLQRPQPAPAVAEAPSVVIAGCEAHVCLLQTALDLLEEELEVWVVTDACASRTERNRDAAFDRLAAAGAELVTTEMVLFEWLRGADHPQFKAVQTLIK